MQIHTEPFTYITADNFLPSDVFKMVQEMAEDDTLPWELNGKVHSSAFMRHLTIDLPVPFHDEVNKLLTHHRPYKKLTRRTYISKQRGPFEHPIHCESPQKIFSHVVYIGPEDSVGTVLHDTNKKPVKVVPWKLNRAFMFAGETDVTWHSYVTRGNETRITLNTFYESTE